MSYLQAPTGQDITLCDREPIHIPGSIQPHGVLLGVNGPDLRIRVISANAAALFGHEPAELLTRPLASLLSDQNMIEVAGLPGLDGGGLPHPLNLRLRHAPAVTRRAFAHRAPAGLMLEVEHASPEHALDAPALMYRTNAAMRRLQAAGGVENVCDSLVQEVQRLTGYDRVKVYRFTEEWHGEVVAETNAGDLPCYLGLHFPASDIPAQARALYARNLERQIPDVNYAPVALCCAGEDPVDLSGAMLRSVSPMHIEYLAAMGVGASMSFSILRQEGALWGLVACHHHEPLHIPAEIRHACVLLVQIAGWKVASAQQADISRRCLGLKDIECALLQTGTDNGDYMTAIQTHSNAVIGLLNANGFALSYRDTITTVGRVPDDENLKKLIAWLDRNGESSLQTDNLAVPYPPAEGWHDTAGMLAIRLSPFGNDMMLWFRPEVAQSVVWAGDPNKPMALQAGEPRLSPGRSFASWTQQVIGRSAPWEPYQVVAANRLRDVVVNLLLCRSHELERINAQILQNNEELQAFSHIAAHDLKEPLRQLETFSQLITDTTSGCASCWPEVGEWLSGIQTGSRRLRRLIDDLAKYARLGRQAAPFAATSLEAILDDVRADLKSLIDGAQATIQSGPLPQLCCDRTQIHQLFQNLIQNAIKYRHPDRLPFVTIAAITRNVGSPRLPGFAPAVEITVADNGIGIDNRFFGEIFEPFRRLHSGEGYGGSGIGLSICRKVVIRHQGRLSVASEPGRGSVFTIMLPIREALTEAATQ